MNIITDRLPPETHNEWVGIDLEIHNMNDLQLHRPNSGQFALASICIGEDVYIIDDEKKLPQAIANVEDNWWIIQNAKFDITQLRRWLPVPPRNRLWDTMIMEQILFGGYYDTFGLDSLARRYLKLHIKKDLQKSFEGGEITNEQVHYSAQDAYLLPKIVEHQKRNVTKDDWNIWMNVDRPALFAFLDFRGFAINDEAWRSLSIRNKKRQEIIDQELPVNPRSPQQVKKYLTKHGFKRLKNTGKDTLEDAIKRFPDAECVEIAKMILESRGYSKNASTYGEDFLDKYLEYDNGVPMIYANFWINGAETGRTSSDKPNMQNIPIRETPEYRKCFIPRPNHKLLIADYSAQEVYIAAFESGDKALMDICNSGKDIYIMTAKTMYDVDIDKSDPMRARMKSVVLGSNYGMSPIGLARKEGISVDEAEEIMNIRRQKFPRLHEYMLEQSRQKVKVKTHAGRTIWLNRYNGQCARNAQNGPIQGGAADCMKQFLSNIHQKWTDVSPTVFGGVGYVHDEIILDVPEEWIPQIKPFVETEMVETANNMFPGMNFRAECHIGESWADK